MLRSAGQHQTVGPTAPAGLRATASLLAALLLLLQLVAAGLRVDPPRRLGPEAASAGVMQNCAQPFHGEQPDDERDHPHCCLLCEWGGRSDLAFLAPSASDLPRPSWSRGSPAPPAPDWPTGQPIGWTSSWSSRAPPVFS